MAFAFAAANMQRDVEKTFLEVRALDPGKDRESLEHLVALRALHLTLARRKLKFAVPKSVHIGEGRERILYRREQFEDSAQDKIPRMRTGEINGDVMHRLLTPGSKLADVTKGRVDIDLLFGEARQMIIQVEPSSRDQVAYVVEVNHTSEDGRNIGGLVCIFIPPYEPF